MKKYDKYKDSGIEWIGEIPNHWSLTRIKFKYFIGRGRVISNEDLIDKGKYPVYSSQTLNNGCLGYIDTYDYDESLITWTTDGANAGTVFLRNGKFNCTNVCGTLKPKSDNNNLVFETFFLKYATQFYKRPDTNGAKIMNNEMAVIFTLNPPVEEQIAIANFLESQTNQIEKLISKKERLIELLQEEQTAVINQAVTKGLEPNIPMKASGIEWLDEIPKDWTIKKLKYLGECQNGISEGADYFGSGYPFISYSDVYKNEILPSLVTGLAQSTDKHQEHYSVKENDVFFTRTSETVEEIGIASTCFQSIKKAVFAGFLIRFRPNSELLYKGFSRYYFRCFIPRYFFVKEMNLVTRASLSQELLKRLPVLLPPFNEQIKISQHLDNMVNKIAITISNLEKEIKLLNEYKTALISEVVTGKIDVRD